MRPDRNWLGIMCEVVVTRYLIQHCTETQTITITSGIQQLEPIARYLAGLGHIGHVVLVDADTNEVIIRVPIEPFAHDVPGDE